MTALEQNLWPATQNGKMRSPYMYMLCISLQHDNTHKLNVVAGS